MGAAERTLCLLDGRSGQTTRSSNTDAACLVMVSLLLACNACAAGQGRSALPDVILLCQVEQLADPGGALGTPRGRLLAICQAWERVLACRPGASALIHAHKTLQDLPACSAAMNPLVLAARSCSCRQEWPAEPRPVKL